MFDYFRLLAGMNGAYIDFYNDPDSEEHDAPASGEFSSSSFARQVCTAVREKDPEGVPIIINLYSDKTPLDFRYCCLRHDVFEVPISHLLAF